MTAEIRKKEQIDKIENKIIVNIQVIDYKSINLIKLTNVNIYTRAGYIKSTICDDEF